MSDLADDGAEGATPSAPDCYDFGMLVNSLHIDWLQLLPAFSAMEQAIASVIVLDSKLLPYLTRERAVDNTLVEMIATMRSKVSIAAVQLGAVVDVNEAISLTFTRISEGARAAQEFERKARRMHGHA